MSNKKLQSKSVYFFLSVFFVFFLLTPFLINPFGAVAEAQDCMPSFTVSLCNPENVANTDDWYLCPNRRVFFTDTTSVQCNIIERSWDFGDGNSVSWNGTGGDNLRTVSHVYNAFGEIAVWLNILVDGDSNTRKLIREIIVESNPVARINTSYIDDPNADLPCEVCFDGRSSTNANIHIWNILGQSFTGPAICQEFPQPGVYDVSLTILPLNEIKNVCCQDTNTIKVYIQTTPSSADFSVDRDTGCAPLRVNFSYERDPEAQYTWTFDDTNSLVNPPETFSYLFNAAKTYHVMLLAQKVNDEATNSIDIMVTGIIPVAGFSITPDPDVSVYCVGDELVFQNTSSNGDEYIWSFADGNILTRHDTSPVEYVYNADGNYSVTLQANAGCGSSDTKEIEVNIKKAPEIPVITHQMIASDPNGCAPVQMEFTAGVSVDTNYVVWDFGDSNISSRGAGVTMTHTYINGGSYNVRLTASNDCGDVDTNVNITICEPPDASFTNYFKMGNACTRYVDQDTNIYIEIPLYLEMYDANASLRLFILEVGLDANLIDYITIRNGELIDQYFPEFQFSVSIDGNSNLIIDGNAVNGSPYIRASEGVLAYLTLEIKHPFATPAIPITIVEIDGNMIIPNAWYTIDGSLKICQPGLIQIDPNCGPYYGGGVVELWGSNFYRDPNNGQNSCIYFGETVIKNASIIEMTDCYIKLTAPRVSSAGNVDVKVKNPSLPAQDTSNMLTYTYLPPMITSLDPGQGPCSGGQVLTISGKYLKEALGATVLFTTNPADPDNVDARTETAIVSSVDLNNVNPDEYWISCQTPEWENRCEAVSVILETQEGIQTSPLTYSYLSNPPIIYSVYLENDPSNAFSPLGGGDRVTIEGVNFQGDIEVYFGDVNAQIILPAENKLVCESPAYGQMGYVDMKVRACEQEYVFPDGFRYTYPVDIFAGHIPEAIPTGGTMQIFWKGERIDTIDIDTNGNYSQQLVDPAIFDSEHPYYDVIIFIDGYLPVLTTLTPQGLSPGLELSKYQYDPNQYTMYTGSVKDSENGGIEGVLVYLNEDPNVFTYTDIYGNYVIYIMNSIVDPKIVLTKKDFEATGPTVIDGQGVFTLLKKTRIQVEFAQTQMQKDTNQVCVMIWAVPGFNNDPNEVRIETSDGNSIEAGFTDSNSYGFTYDYSSVNDEIKFVIYADTTEDNNVDTGAYFARNIVTYDPNNDIKTYQLEVKEYAEEYLNMATAFQAGPDVEVILLPKTLQATCDIRIILLKGKEGLNISDPGLVDASKYVYGVDLMGNSLTENGYVVLSLPYDPNYVVDPQTNTMVDPYDRDAQLKAFLDGWLYINHFEDVFDSSNTKNNPIPAKDIMFAYRDEETLENYVVFRVRSLSYFSIGTTTVSRDFIPFKTGDEGGGCFVETVKECLDNGL